MFEKEAEEICNQIAREAVEIRNVRKEVKNV